MEGCPRDGIHSGSLKDFNGFLEGTYLWKYRVQVQASRDVDDEVLSLIYDLI